MRKTMTTVLATGLVLMGAPAFAGGSDSPTPYEVTESGITLPEGVTFQEHGHVNVRTESGAGRNIHFDQFSEWVGASFIPWSAFNIQAPECVAWVQVHGFNEHFGEGGQSPVCLTSPEPTPPVIEEPPVVDETPGEEPPVGEEPTEVVVTPVENPDLGVPENPGGTGVTIRQGIPETEMLAATGFSEKQMLLIWILGLAGASLLMGGLSLKLRIKEV